MDTEQMLPQIRMLIIYSFFRKIGVIDSYKLVDKK